jgi:uncharacterized protein YbaR (Trm112 family)
MSVDPELLEIVRCPKCLGRLVERTGDGSQGLACEACRLLYPVEDDIPNFLIDEARPLA